MKFYQVLNVTLYLILIVTGFMLIGIGVATFMSATKTLVMAVSFLPCLLGAGVIYFGCTGADRELRSSSH